MYVFNGIEIWTVGWPFYNGNITVINTEKDLIILAQNCSAEKWYISYFHKGSLMVPIFFLYNIKPLVNWLPLVSYPSLYHNWHTSKLNSFLPSLVLKLIHHYSVKKRELLFCCLVLVLIYFRFFDELILTVAL